MQYGFYTDNKLETFENWPWRCPKFSPLPAGKKNVAVLGCSHTYGVGLEENETWVHHISQHNTTIGRMRWCISDKQSHFVGINPEGDIL